MAEQSAASRAAQWTAIAAAVGTGLASLFQSMGAMPDDRARPAISAMRLEVADLRAEVAVLTVRIDYLERGRMGGPTEAPRHRVMDAARRARAGALAEMPSADPPQ